MKDVKASNCTEENVTVEHETKGLKIETFFFCLVN